MLLSLENNIWLIAPLDNMIFEQAENDDTDELPTYLL